MTSRSTDFLAFLAVISIWLLLYHIVSRVWDYGVGYQEGYRAGIEKCYSDFQVPPPAGEIPEP